MGMSWLVHPLMVIGKLVEGRALGHAVGIAAEMDEEGGAEKQSGDDPHANEVHSEAFLGGGMSRMARWMR